MYQQRLVRWRVFLVPALLTAVAYVDPGNFGTNLEAGSTHGYGLLWVVLRSGRYVSGDHRCPGHAASPTRTPPTQVARARRSSSQPPLQ